ncbi:MAG TPA: class I SAM-dependent methyltransferase [Thermoanaerobaculia bacterium]|nr:class I SAM-dependent methyltransferase [Thermoanaerobaculia bacterium]
MSEETELVDWLLAEHLPETGPVDTLIHPADEMLGFLTEAHGGDPTRGRVAYFVSGLAIFDAYRQLVTWRFGGWQGVGRLLDFASGFGRVTRLLVRHLPPERVSIAEIVPEAVHFQAERFGVHALASARHPDDFSCGERFDAIFVTSLFTHLPAPSFRAWLGRLAFLLAPGGMLVFTTHDASLRRTDGPFPEEGLLFESVSESRTLETSDYGSTWVSEDFVRRAAREADPELACHRIPRGILHHQDLYVLLKPPLPELGTPAFVGDPEGMVEQVSLAADGQLRLQGWAFDPGWGDAVTVVRVLLDREPIGECRAFGRRRDVARALSIPIKESLAWELTCPVPLDRPRSEQRLMVSLGTASGRQRVLVLSSLETALLVSAERELAALRAELAAVKASADRQIRRLTSQLGAMEASRFWRLRRVWFRIKGLFGRE